MRFTAGFRAMRVRAPTVAACTWSREARQGVRFIPRLQHHSQPTSASPSPIKQRRKWQCEKALCDGRHTAAAGRMICLSRRRRSTRGAEHLGLKASVTSVSWLAGRSLPRPRRAKPQNAAASTCSRSSMQSSGLPGWRSLRRRGPGGAPVGSTAPGGPRCWTGACRCTYNSGRGIWIYRS